MDASHTADAPSPVVPQIRTLLLCDLTESTRLVERVGDRHAAELMRRHDQLVRHLLQQHAGREIDKSDGFLALFEHPVQAVAFALDYQRELRALGNAEGWPISARVGIHVGDVLLWENTPAEIARGAKPLNVEGLAKPVAARLMQLALPGQILLSGVAYSLASRAESPTLPERVSWCTHGRYRFKGVPAPMLVHEVGEPGLAPLRAPVSGDKAWRDVPLWRRPAVLGAQLVGLLAVAAIVAMATLRTPDAIAFRERDWVVVGSLNNLTGDPRFEGALETALRISLEQSRHVNVLPDLRVRDALQRMGLQPDAGVDRDVGSEIALREGARALLLPTVAEIGGRVRVSLEVVDPNSRSTVFAQSYDGVGGSSVFSSINAASAELRARLGEALRSIEQSAEPVEKATSSSLEALRAYTLANRAMTLGRLGDAHRHFDQALRLDPDFALARIGLARVHFARGEDTPALEQVRRSAGLSERLSARERLYVDAWLATLEGGQDHLGMWRALADLYPDFHPAALNVALFGWYANRFAEAAVYAERASVPQSAVRAHALYLLGTARLALGEVDGALTAFDEANTLGSAGRGIAEAAAYAVSDRFDAALRALNRDEASSVLAARGRRLMSIAILASQGRWGEAKEQAAALGRAALAADSSDDWLAAAATLAVLRAVDGDAAEAGWAREIARRGLGLLRDGEPADREGTAMATLIACRFLLQAGETQCARQAVEAARPVAARASLQHLGDMVAIVSAQLLLADGQAEQALRAVSERLTGFESWLVHAQLAEVHAASGQPTQALQEIDWLTRHRGWAYAERGLDYALLVENALASRTARLRAAEIALSAGERDRARHYLRGFEQDLPTLSGANALEERVGALRAAVN